MKKILLFLCSLVAGTSLAFSEVPDTLLITEAFIGHNPARTYVEITNIGKSPADLSNYFLVNSTNGGPLSEASTDFIQLVGTLEPGETYLVLQDDRRPVDGVVYPPGHPDGNDVVPPFYRSFPYDLMCPNEWDSPTPPGSRALRMYQGDDAIALVYDADADGVFRRAYDVVVDKVGHDDDGYGGRFVFPSVAGVSEATRTHVLIRKASVELPNYGDFYSGRGVSAEDSEWIVVPFDPSRTGHFFTTVKNHGGQFPWQVSSSTVTIEEDQIVVPWGVRRDSLYVEFEWGDNMAWYMRWGPDTLESVRVHTLDSFYMYLAGNEATVKKYGLVSSPPADDMNLVFPVLERNQAGELVVQRYQVSHGLEMDTISGVPFGTRADTLLKYLEKAPAASWEIEFVGGEQRPDVREGDKLVVTAADNSKKEYYILPNEYVPSSNAFLGAIYIYGDTLWGFTPTNLTYTEVIPPDTDFPALSATPQSLNARVHIERPANIRGGREDRMAKIRVTAADDSTELVYTVLFEIMKMDELWNADPFFSKVISGSGWSKGFDIFNPGNTVLPISDYIIAQTHTQTLSTVVSGTNMGIKMRPGFTIDSARMDVGIYFNERAYPFMLDMEPGQSLFFARGNANLTGDAFFSGPAFGTLPHFRDANANAAHAWEIYGFVDGNEISRFFDTRSLSLLRIDNDSIFNGLKAANDPDDYTLVDVFGALGEANQRLFEGVFISANDNITHVRKRDIWRGNPENYGSFGTAEEPGEWDNIPGTNILLGTHIYDPYDGYISTVSSLAYRVSLDFGPDQTIGLVPPGTTVNDFLSNIVPNGSDALLTVTNADSTEVKTGEELIVEGDRLNVLAGTRDNYTIYTLNVQQPSNDALLTSSVYEIGVEGSAGQISGIPALTSIEDLLAGINIPAGARLTVIDDKDQQVGTEAVLFDTLLIVKTLASDNILLEVLAEDGVTKIIYNLIQEVTDPYVTSVFYLVLQDRFLIDMFQPYTLVRTFLSRLVPSTGSTMTIVDKMGNERGTEGVMYKDDRLLVSDGTKTTIYNLKSLYDPYSTDATLQELAVDGASIDGFDPNVKNYVVTLGPSDELPPIPVVTAVASHPNAIVTITQAENLAGTEAEKTATIRVRAEDGATEAIYTIVFDHEVTGLDKAESKPLHIYSEGNTIYIRISEPGNDNEVEVYNITGQKILHRRISGTFEPIQVNTHTGIFIVKVKAGGNVYVERVVLR